MPHHLKTPAGQRPRLARAASLFLDREWRSIGRSLKLSPRELQIVQCLFDDDTEAATALRLGISSHTVHTYLERLYRKVGVSSRVSLLVRVFGEHLAVNGPRPGVDSPEPVRKAP